MFHLLAAYYHFLATIPDHLSFSVVATTTFVYAVVLCYTVWHLQKCDGFMEILFVTFIGTFFTGVAIFAVAFIWPLVTLFATLFLTLHFSVCLITRTPSPILAKLKSLNKKD